MFTIKGKCALVTGASSGIGEAFCRAFAERGADIVLVARSEDRLRVMAQELTEQYHVRADVVPSDLSHPGASQILFQEVQSRGHQVDVLVNNAGFGTYGRFDEVSAQREHDEVMLNVAAVVDLTHLFVPGMIERANGAIINVASATAFLPTPYMATYAASKAFVLSFTEALWAEYRTRGVRVLAVCPGATKTRFFDVVGSAEAQWGFPGTPPQVVAAALKALERGSPSVVPGWFNRIYVNLPRIMPRSLALRIAERTMRPRPPR